MKNAFLVKFAAGAVLVITLLVWTYGGSQIGLWKDKLFVQRIEPVTQQTYTEEIEVFLPGIETLIAGGLLFVALFLLSRILEQRSSAES